MMLGHEIQELLVHASQILPELQIPGFPIYETYQVSKKYSEIILGFLISKLQRLL